MTYTYEDYCLDQYEINNCRSYHDDYEDEKDKKIIMLKKELEVAEEDFSRLRDELEKIVMLYDNIECTEFKTQPSFKFYIEIFKPISRMCIELGVSTQKTQLAMGA